jgi:hypothetical protein
MAESAQATAGRIGNHYHISAMSTLLTDVGRDSRGTAYDVRCMLDVSRQFL